MPNQMNNLSNDQLKALLSVMEDKIDQTQNYTQLAQQQLTPAQILQQMSMLLNSMNNASQQAAQQQTTQSTNSIAAPEPKEVEETNMLIDLDLRSEDTKQSQEFSYMQTNSMQEQETTQTYQTPPQAAKESGTPQQKQKIENVLDKIEQLLEQTGIDRELLELIKNEASQEALNSKIKQFISIANMIPEIGKYGSDEIHRHTTDYINEMRIIYEMENQKIQKQQLISNTPKVQVTSTPSKINLAPEEKNQTKVVDVKDIFKRFRGNSKKPEEENLENTTHEIKQQPITPPAQQYTDIAQKQETKIEPAPSVLEKLMKKAPSPTEAATQLKNFELLKNLLLIYIEGAANRELIRNNEDLLHNKTFLLDLYEKLMTKEDITKEIEISKRILQRLDNQLGMVKAANGTIATWVELDESIYNIRNMFLTELNRAVQ